MPSQASPSQWVLGPRPRPHHAEQAEEKGSLAGRGLWGTRESKVHTKGLTVPAPWGWCDPVLPSSWGQAPAMGHSAHCHEPRASSALHPAPFPGQGEAHPPARPPRTHGTLTRSPPQMHPAADLSAWPVTADLTSPPGSPDLFQGWATVKCSTGLKSGQQNGTLCTCLSPLGGHSQEEGLKGSRGSGCREPEKGSTPKHCPEQTLPEAR